MMLLFNFILTVVCLGFVFILHGKFVRSARINHFRFRIYALRDELCILAMKGQISSGSPEFKALLTMMNASALNLERFNVVEFIKSLNKFRTDQEIQAGFTRAFLNGNEEYERIYREVIGTIRHMLRRELYFLTLFLSLIIKVLMTVSVFKKALHHLQNRSALIGDLDSWLANPVPVKVRNR